MALNALQRLDAEDELMHSIASCINLGHPHRDLMMGVNMEQVRGFSEPRLLAMSERLRVWIEAKRAATIAAGAGD